MKDKNILSIYISILISLFIYYQIIFISCINIYIGLFLLLIFTILLLLYKNYITLFIFMFVVLLFSNIFLSFFSYTINEVYFFKAIQGFDFLLISFIFILIIITNKIKISFLFYLLLIVFFIYFLLGILNNGFMNAIIYLRFFLYPLFFLFLGIHFSSVLKQINKIIYIFFFITILLTFLFYMYELLLTNLYYDLFNIDNYFYLKTGHFESSTNLISMNTRKFFNFALFSDLLIYRAKGFLLHSPSQALLFSIMAIFFYMQRNFFIFSILMVFIILNGGKGAILFIIFTLILNPLLKKSSYIKILILIFLYILFIVLLGIKNNNPHVLGLLNGLYSFYSNPMGNGFGYSGTLSKIFNAEKMAGDSAFGILLSQTGIAAFFIYYVYLKIILIIKEYDYSILLAALLTLLINSLFQEEAFSPYSMGLLLLLIGIRHTNYLVIKGKLRI